MMNIKVVSWNLAYWNHKKVHNQAWEYFIEEINADIYLFQESKPLKKLLEKSNILWYEIGGTRDWGTGIYTSNIPLKCMDIKTDYVGSLVLGEVKISNDITLTIISLYGLLETIGKTAYSITTLHRMLSDLTGILNGHIGGQRKIILGGDLNASIQCDIAWGGKAHNILFQRMDDFNLLNCYELFYSDFVQTHRHAHSEKPWQNDYFFISKSMRKNLKSCDVINNDQVNRFSDHNPVIIELEF